MNATPYRTYFSHHGYFSHNCFIITFPDILFIDRTLPLCQQKPAVSSQNLQSASIIIDLQFPCQFPHPLNPFFRFPSYTAP